VSCSLAFGCFRFATTFMTVLFFVARSSLLSTLSIYEKCYRFYHQHEHALAPAAALLPPSIGVYAGAASAPAALTGV
jgi:hypothetical protein